MISDYLLTQALKPANLAELEYIKELERAAVALVERETRRYFGPVRTRTEVVVGTGRGPLYLEGPVALDIYDVALVTSVNEAAYAGGDQTEIVDDEDDGYVVREGVLYRKGGGSWARGYEYEVVYQQGYDEGDEPADIRQAVMELVTLWFTIRLPVALGTVAPEVPHNVAEIIAANRRARV